MFGVLAGQRQKPSWCLHVEDEAFHARFLGRAHDLVGVEIRRIEHLFVFVAVAPFLVRESVHGEVQEAIKLHLVPAQLTLGGHRAVRGGRLGISGAGPGNKASKRRHCEKAEERCLFHAYGTLFYASNWRGSMEWSGNPAAKAEATP